MACEVEEEEAEEVLYMVHPSAEDGANVVQPGEESFHLQHL